MPCGVHERAGWPSQVCWRRVDHTRKLEQAYKYWGERVLQRWVNSNYEKDTFRNIEEYCEQQAQRLWPNAKATPMDIYKTKGYVVCPWVRVM